MKDNAVLAAADAVEHYQRTGTIPPALESRCTAFGLRAEALRQVADIQANLDSADNDEDPEDEQD